MTISSQEELISIVKTLMGGSYENISEIGYISATDMTLKELPWTLPLSAQKKEYWLVERSKRNVIFILLTESAHKFKYKEISLQHRFANYFKLIDKMDSDFEKAIDDDPVTFADLSTQDALCFYVTNGFIYDQFGKDITYR